MRRVRRGREETRWGRGELEGEEGRQKGKRRF